MKPRTSGRGNLVLDHQDDPKLRELNVGLAPAPARPPAGGGHTPSNYRRPRCERAVPYSRKGCRQLTLRGCTQVDANDFVGLEITVADRKKRMSAADWLCAASIAHDKKYTTLVDHADQDLEHYKQLRKEACRNFFYAAMGGLFLAIWANEVMHSHGRKNSFQSLSLQMTMLCSTGLAIYFLCGYYHAELCVARLKVYILI
jgi:hypothetical protein